MTDVETTLIQYLRIKNQIKQLEEEAAELLGNEGFAQLAPSTYVYGKVEVVVSRNARFDPKRATELYPLGENGENMNLYRAQVDSALAKVLISPEEYEACQKEYPNNKVEIRLK